MKSKKTKWEGLRGRRGSENQIEWKRGSGKENDACVKFKRKKKKFDARKWKKIQLIVLFVSNLLRALLSFLFCMQSLNFFSKAHPNYSNRNYVNWRKIILSDSVNQSKFPPCFLLFFFLMLVRRFVLWNSKT